MNGFYILAHDQERLKTTLDIVDRALDDLQANHRGKRLDRASFSLSIFLSTGLFSLTGDQYYADSYGTGQLFRGVLLHFLQRFDEAHEAFDEIMRMFVFSIEVVRFGRIYIVLGRRNSTIVRSYQPMPV